VSTGDVAAVTPPADEADATSPIGESRWPPALALLAFLALNITLRVWLPSGAPMRVPWLLPAIEAVLLALLILGQPGRIDTQRARLHRIALMIVVVLVAAALWSTGLLVYDLIRATGVTQSPTKLLASGGIVWLGNNLSFAML